MILDQYVYQNFSNQFFQDFQLWEGYIYLHPFLKITDKNVLHLEHNQSSQAAH